jgi:hypothetical protein
MTKHPEHKQTVEMNEREALMLFKGWFHNKMTVILLLSQYPKLRKKWQDAANQLAFLRDLEHHFLRPVSDRNSFHRAVRWLSGFFRLEAGRVTSVRSKRVLEMVRLIYDAFGFPFYWQMSGKDLPKIDG